MTLRPLKRADSLNEQFPSAILDSLSEAVVVIDGEVTQRIEGETSGRDEFLILSLLSSDYELPRFNGELPETMEVDWARVWETGPEQG